MGRYEEALPYLRAGVDGARRALSPEHPQTLKGINNLGTLLVRSGDLAGGASLLQEALSIRRKTLGDDDISTLMSINNLAQLLFQSDRLDEALVLAREALERRQRTLGGDHPNTLMSMGTVGSILEAKGEKAEAFGYMEAARAGMVEALGQDHWVTLETTRGVANLHVDLGRPGEALTILDGMEKDARRVFIEGNRPRLGSFFTTRGRSRTALGDFAAAEADFQQAVEVLGDPLPTDKRGKRLRTLLVELYERWHVENPTGGYDAKAAKWRDMAAPPS
jgi:tetratricopeptide (TPR) repeat protein